MSLSTKKKFAAAAATLAAGALIFTGTSGANFSASDSGHASIQSGTLTVALSDVDNVDTFTLNYPNLAPGETKVDKFTVENTGSIPADVSIGQLSNTVASLGSANPAQLKASIDGYLAPTSIVSLSNSTGLGSLNPGQSRTYVVRISLDSAAGNEWQNKSVSTDVTVTLNQH